MVSTLILIGFSTIIFGVASLVSISKARNRLSQGSIRRYMDNFAVCLAFIVIFSVWQTIRSLLGIDINVSEFITYPEYIFLIFAYIAFIIASFRVTKISTEFGFKEDGRKIAEIVKEKATNSKPLKLQKKKS